MTRLLRYQMRLYANAWYPAWLVGKNQDTDRFVLVDQIRHVQYE